MADMIHEQGGQEDHHEETTHPFDGLDAYVFDIQPSFLVKAIGVFDLRPVTPLSIHGLGLCGSADREVDSGQ